MRIKYIQYLLIGEGTSDNGLIEPLSRLCIECGADEVVDSTPNLDLRGAGHSVIAKLSVVAQQEPNIDIIFIHRDADSPNYQPRIEEINQAANNLNLNIICIPVIPVQATESWILIDEQSIREVASNPAGRIDLGLPRPQHVEQIADPKSRLQQALLLAAELRGRRRDEFKKDFSRHRRQLLERLTPDSPVCDVPAWQRLVAAIQDAIQRL